LHCDFVLVVLQTLEFEDELNDIITVEILNQSFSRLDKLLGDRGLLVSPRVLQNALHDAASIFRGTDFLTISDNRVTDELIGFWGKSRDALLDHMGA